MADGSFTMYEIFIGFCVGYTVASLGILFFGFLYRGYSK